MKKLSGIASYAFIFLVGFWLSQLNIEKKAESQKANYIEIQESSEQLEDAKSKDHSKYCPRFDY